MIQLKKYLSTVIRSCSFFLLLAACSEDQMESPYGGQGAKPDPVKNVTVKNIAGGAEISYSLPKNDDLLYVKAVYAIREGVEREAKASYHQKSLVVDGFPQVGTYDVALYTVSRSEIQSEPVIVQVAPDTPPVISAFESLEVSETFGGIAIAFENSGQADLALTVITPDSSGKMAPAQTFYTKQESGVLASRGFDAERRRFGVYLRDRWENYSDTLYTELTPLYEDELDKSLFEPLPLPTDDWRANANGSEARWGMHRLWDGVAAGGNNQFIGEFLEADGFPSSLSFDLGVTASLSRLVYFPRGENENFYVNSPRRFEIWGSNDPNPDGSWDSWTKLLDCEWIKPSGLPSGFTEEDKQLSINGVEFEFPPGTPQTRYIRFRTLEMWSGIHIQIWELTFYGNASNAN